MNVREEARAEGDSVRAIILRQEFVFDLRHVHAGGTLGFASLAFEAQIEHGVHALGGEMLGRQMPR